MLSGSCSMVNACPITWASRIVESFMNTMIFSPSICLPAFHTIGSRYIVMQESLELNTKESQTACMSVRYARTLLKQCTTLYTLSVFILYVYSFKESPCR